MKILGILVLFIFSFNVFGVMPSAVSQSRIIECVVNLDGAVADKTTFYLMPGQKVTARMSLMAGSAEIFLAVEHNMMGKSLISVKDYHGGVEGTQAVTSKTVEKVSMKELLSGPSEIIFRVNKLNKDAKINCRRVK